MYWKKASNFPFFHNIQKNKINNIQKCIFFSKMKKTMILLPGDTMVSLVFFFVNKQKEWWGPNANSSLDVSLNHQHTILVCWHETSVNSRVKQCRKSWLTNSGGSMATCNNINPFERKKEILASSCSTEVSRYCKYQVPGLLESSQQWEMT